MKTLYKRIAHMIMALVMLVSLTATVSAAEAYSFSIEDDPFEIYDILLADHGKAVADKYKLTLMTNDSGYNPEGNLDQYALGPTVLYENTALQIAADYANSLDNTTAAQPEVTKPIVSTQPSGYGFTTDDEPAEIYAIILRDYGKEKADEYKRAVLIYTGTTDSIIFNVDDYELGPKDQYKASDLQNAINHVANLIDPATVGSTQSDNNTGRMCPFTADDKPITIYNALASAYGLEVARGYKNNLSAHDYAEKHNGSMDGFNGNAFKVESKDYYSVETRQTAIEWVVYYINQHPDQPLPKNQAAPEAQKFADVKPGDWYYEAANALTEGGLFTGYSDGKFHPDEPITVAQFATVFCRLYDLDTEFNRSIVYNDCIMPTMVNGVLQNPMAYGERKQFTPEDAKNNPHWGYGAVYNLVWETDQYSIVDPKLMDTPITRGQLMEEMNIAVIATRRSYDYPRTKIDMTTIPDADSFWVGAISIMGPVYKTSDGNIIEVKYGNEQRLDGPMALERPENYEIYSANRTWAASSIELAYEYGITTGVDENHTANPNGLVTRAQFCQMLYNAGFTHADMDLCRNNGGLSGGSN